MSAAMVRHIISERLAPSSAPFSHIVINGGIGYVSGLLGQDGQTGAIVSSDVGAQARHALGHLRTLLNEVGLNPSQVLRTTVYLVDYADFNNMNAAYRETFTAPFPARTTLAVSALPLEARFQIDAIFDAAEYVPSSS